MRQKGGKYTKIGRFVTLRTRYNEGMNTLLLASPALGAIWLVVLFIVIFLLVHAVKLARLGLRVQPPSKPPKDEVTAPKEPPKKEETPKKRPARPLGSVYYIVEKKRRTKDKDEG